ncbi:hypothetical protein [Lactococcus petauri]|uniref:Uncharacterized protein n=2 Tax=Lactococcus petauri TaxID=1940789 RepID=A0AAJ2IXS9_9LACT|nr:hypothetical protein [Lactococcus petauri]MDT2526402.1 hypothetical protein [Lactococcus petauri]MDT2540947.1 hypothetical protein [Lactococcus petauri]MDT2557521.1 hypothetical protein [Lactococcus petauri]MDT2559404.1 hypothetical protein [Lactococcus petauri]MDT2567977.1 hypothetical protein [Lactococcus petauri]
MDRYEMAIGLIVIAIGSFIAGAACVGIQLEKVKRQRDEALDEAWKRAGELDKYDGTKRY